MKRILIFLCFYLMGLSVYAQGIDKPKYQIEVYRLNNYLGVMEIELYPIIAPLHTAMFDSLVGQQFYDSTAFHRVVPGFVIQGGDPNSISGPISTWGYGQPWQPTVNAEFNAVQHVRGTIGAARDADPNSATSQFYICIGSPLFLDGNYTVYGRVTSGMNIADSIVLSPRDANDVPLQKLSMFVTAIGTNPAVPTTPQLNLPIDSAMLVMSSQTFSWSAADSAVLYTIQFSTDSLFSTIAWSDTIPLTQTLFSSMAGSTEYFWRVRSNNGGHESPWSDVRRFTSAIAAPTGVYPANAGSGIPININFIWTSVPGASSYFLQVAKSPTFSASSLVFSQNSLTDTTQVVTGLQTNRVHYWRVQTNNSIGIPGMTTPNYFFTTGTSTGIQDITAGGVLINGPWPNPASNQVTIQVKAEQPMEMKFIVRDMSGRQLLLNDVQIRGGDNEVQLSLSGINSGLYLIEMLAEGYREFRQIVKE